MKAEPQRIEYLPGTLIVESFNAHEKNNLFSFFVRQIGKSGAMAIFEKYVTGTSKYWPGATAFWQVDQVDRVRQCKVMLFDPTTGKRVKRDGQSFIIFMGKKLLENPDANLQQCLFGCHLLNREPSLPVAIVESEKTAMYCSHFFPELIWLATGGKQGCSLKSREVIEPLRNRKIILFPDLNATKDWQEKARQISEMIPCKIHVSTYLETMATDAERAEGLDLMDFLLKEQKSNDIQNEEMEAPEASSISCKPSQEIQLNDLIFLIPGRMGIDEKFKTLAFFKIDMEKVSITLQDKTHSEIQEIYNQWAANRKSNQQ
jgi:hypothetical protein